jgi:hypothetical protein
VATAELVQAMPSVFSQNLWCPRGVLVLQHAVTGECCVCDACFAERQPESLVRKFVSDGWLCLLSPCWAAKRRFETFIFVACCLCCPALCALHQPTVRQLLLVPAGLVWLADGSAPVGLQVALFLHSNNMLCTASGDDQCWC